MPKVIVLYSDSANQATAALAQAVAHGASHVRFTEVEARAANGAEPLHDYDGVVLMVSSPADIAAVTDVLHATHPGQTAGAFLNTVFAVVGDDEGALLPRVAQLGGIIVTVPRASDDAGRHAVKLGERVAKVVDWVRHARSHEQHDDHAHSHNHA